MNSDAPDPRQELVEGERCEQLGVLERAQGHYQRAAELATDPATASEAWRRLSGVRRARGDWEGALAAAHQSRVMARRAGLDDAMADALNAEAAIYVSRGELTVARPLLEEAVEVAESDRTMGITLQSLGEVAARSGETEAAERYLQASAAHFRRSGYRWGEACVLTSLAGVALDREEFRLADATATRAIAAARELGDLNLVAVATINRAESMSHLGDLSRAWDLASEALGYFTGSGDTFRQIQVYKLLGEISVCREDNETARFCFEKALAIASRIEARLESADLDRRLGGLSSADATADDSVNDLRIPTPP